MKLTFYGGARTVTGSNYLLESGGTRILIDCGLNQGGSYAEKKNWESFAYEPKGIAAVFATHGHIDHTGRLPQLVRHGFAGTIYSTEPTRDFAEMLLLDSEHLLREDAERHKKEPLYNTEDVARAVSAWRGVSYHEKITVGPFTVEFYDAGHILGSAIVVVEAEGKRVAFSGDLGNMPAEFINPRESVPDADYILIESVYGNRVHEDAANRKDIMEDLIEETVKANGTVVIPAFALERTQEMIFELNELVEHGRIPRVPVFIDSPLAIKLTSIYQKYADNPHYFSAVARAALKRGDAIFDFPGLRMTLTPEQSKEINDIKPPKVILAGSGMSQGGRILHHEVRYLPDPKSLILFVGYQGDGSLGRKILEGAGTVKILGQEIDVRCRVKQISGYSAHADQPQLLEWLRPARLSAKKVFVVQGEETEELPLAQKIRDELAMDAVMPEAGETVEL
ncbi:MAG: MBL fold metallo-hydrolase [Candidatus Jorgensenbacteria bacterium]